MDIVSLKLSELHPYENNPRQNDDAVDAVAASIKEFGFKVPIVVDKNNVIVAGHMPSCVEIGKMGGSHQRTHHQINWDCCVPKILNQKYRKEKNDAEYRRE